MPFMVKYVVNVEGNDDVIVILHVRGTFHGLVLVINLIIQVSIWILS